MVEVGQYSVFMNDNWNKLSPLKPSTVSVKESGRTVDIRAPFVLMLRNRPQRRINKGNKA